MVLRVTAGERALLLCGDIQQEAMISLMRGAGERRLNLQADVMELPHHGSYNEVAAAFVERVRPVVVMQSTGWTRWQRDRWAPHLANAHRLVTVRDGACSVTIERTGEIRFQRFLPEGIQAGGVEIE
jgi:beta-lactamase superfamily II metal-dependent hydrolase